MGILTRISMWLARFLSGRNGMDNIAWHGMWAGVILYMFSPFLGIAANLLSLALLLYAAWRMLSRNVSARRSENTRYIQFNERIRRSVSQFFARLKGRKTHKYFRCPGCKNRLRMKRGSGEKTITCPVCRHQFTQKA